MAAEIDRGRGRGATAEQAGEKTGEAKGS